MHSAAVGLPLLMLHATEAAAAAAAVRDEMLACTVLLTVNAYAAAVGLSSGPNGVGVGAASEQLRAALLLRGTTDYRRCVQQRRAARVS
jgi:hypothetical protein